MIFRNSKSKEVGFSSVYNYLVDRFETHGLGPVILERNIEALLHEAARQLLSVTGLEVQNTEAEYSLQEIGQIDSMPDRKQSTFFRGQDLLTALFKGTVHVAFHQYHPNGKNYEEATWIFFEAILTMKVQSQVKIRSMSFGF